GWSDGVAENAGAVRHCAGLIAAVAKLDAACGGTEFGEINRRHDHSLNAADAGGFPAAPAGHPMAYGLAVQRTAYWRWFAGGLAGGGIAGARRRCTRGGADSVGHAGSGI